jgi:hypothetical protein
MGRWTRHVDWKSQKAQTRKRSATAARGKGGREVDETY